MRTNIMHTLASLVTALALLFCAGALAWGAETASMIKADDLKAEPFRDAKVMAKLAAGDIVEILKREGAWYQVKSAKGKGWVRMLNVRRGVATKATAAATLSSAAGLASGRAGTGQVVATTGIRGLNEEQLKTAQYNEEEVKRAEAFTIPAAAVRAFAQAGKLAARKVNYLQAPAETR